MLSSLNPFDSGETLRAKWGERLLPAARRNNEFDFGVGYVANAISRNPRYAEAMQAKSSSDAGKAIDKIIKTEVVMNNLAAEEVGTQTNKAAVRSTENGLDPNLMLENVMRVHEESSVR